MAVVYTKRVPDGLVVVIAQPSTAVEKAMTSVLLSTRCCSAAESRKLQKVRHRPDRVGFDHFADAPFYPQGFTGVLMKSRLLSSTPQWRKMSYAVVQWK